MNTTIKKAIKISMGGAVILLIILSAVMGVKAAKKATSNTFATDTDTSSTIIVMASDFNRIDTTAIESWCMGYDEGAVRMVGAQYYGRDEEGGTVVEDEQGNLWGINCYEVIDTMDFLLLWIADNNTPDNLLDDSVIKVWREAY